MAAHHQLLYHIIFSIKDRRPLLRDEKLQAATWAYMAGICNTLGGSAIQIGGYHDHAPLLVRIPARLSVSEYVGKVKGNSSRHINAARTGVRKFRWQDGYGAFSVSPSASAQVSAYIQNQRQHHQRRSFQEEFVAFLKRHNVDYDPASLWE